jgi:hypothetical protein
MTFKISFSLALYAQIHIAIATACLGKERLWALAIMILSVIDTKEIGF